MASDLAITSLTAPPPRPGTDVNSGSRSRHYRLKHRGTTPYRQLLTAASAPPRVPIPTYEYLAKRLRSRRRQIKCIDDWCAEDRARPQPAGCGAVRERLAPFIMPPDPHRCCQPLWLAGSLVIDGSYRRLTHATAADGARRHRAASPASATMLNSRSTKAAHSRSATSCRVLCRDVSLQRCGAGHRLHGLGACRLIWPF